MTTYFTESSEEYPDVFQSLKQKPGWRQVRLEEAIDQAGPPTITVSSLPDGDIEFFISGSLVVSGPATFQTTKCRTVFFNMFDTLTGEPLDGPFMERGQNERLWYVEVLTPSGSFLNCTAGVGWPDGNGTNPNTNVGVTGVSFTPQADGSGFRLSAVSSLGGTGGSGGTSTSFLENAMVVRPAWSMDGNTVKTRGVAAQQIGPKLAGNAFDLKGPGTASSLTSTRDISGRMVVYAAKRGVQTDDVTIRLRVWYNAQKWRY